MSVYKPWYLTKYLASAIQSANTSANKITFKYMFGSSDSIDEKDYSGLTNDLMKSIKLDDIAKISSNEVSNTDATIVAVFTNKGVAIEHTMNTIGIVAEYNGKEFLAAICSANTPYLMPQESDNEHVEYTIRAVLGISNTGVVSVSMDPSAVATNEQLDKVRTSLKSTNDKANANQKSITDIKDPNSGVKVANAVHSDNAGYADNAGRADNAVHADKSSYADKSGSSGWANGAGQANKLVDGSNVNVNDLNVAGTANLNDGLVVEKGLSSKGNLYVDGDTVTKKIDVNGPLFIHDILRGVVQSYSFTTHGLQVFLVKFGQVVQCSISGVSEDRVPPYTDFRDFLIPEEFRPISDIVVPAENNFKNKAILINSNGIAYNLAEEISPSVYHAGATWITVKW